MLEALEARMGWQVQVTNMAASRLSLVESVLGYRAGTCMERAFHPLKEKPLGIRPLFVHRDDQVRGLTHLLRLALRVLTLFEVLVRRGQDQDRVDLAGLYPGQAKRTTDCPMANRVLEAIARTGVTLIQEESDEGCRRHMTALPVLVRRVLGDLGLSDDVYPRLLINSDQALFHYAKEEILGRLLRLSRCSRSRHDSSRTQSVQGNPHMSRL